MLKNGALKTMNKSLPSLINKRQRKDANKQY